MIALASHPASQIAQIRGFVETGTLPNKEFGGLTHEEELQGQRPKGRNKPHQFLCARFLYSTVSLPLGHSVPLTSLATLASLNWLIMRREVGGNYTHSSSAKSLIIYVIQPTEIPSSLSRQTIHW